MTEFPEFKLKQFSLNHQRSSMKVSTDSVLLGALCEANNAKRVLDIGTGCGILSLMMAQKSQAQITAIDVDLASVAEADENFKRSAWSDRLQAKRMDLGTFSGLNETAYDLIITNPPYFDQPLASPNLQRNIARNANLLTFETLVAAVKTLLAPNGDFWLILPTSEFQKFSVTATAYLLGCSDRIDISPRPEESPVLTVSHWKHLSNEWVHRISTLSIRDRNHQFSEGFKAVTADFYPAF
jgi:tRNA1Val (adenine37-N6)-methyltransferase